MPELRRDDHEPSTLANPSKRPSRGDHLGGEAFVVESRWDDVPPVNSVFRCQALLKPVVVIPWT